MLIKDSFSFDIDPISAGHVYIRVVFVGDKTVETRHGIRKEAKNNNLPLPEKFKYKAKALFAFEVIDGVDVCFFGLHVQEYDDKCLQPNQRRVYIGYLDSVKFFKPAYLRTELYHELIISYLEYTRNMGYVWAHIWACPPSEGDDYIFHCHPPEQKVPKAKRLQDWYKAILQKAITKNVIVGYQDIHKQSSDDGVANCAQLPYFDGDFWPSAIEDLIMEVQKEQAEAEQEQAEDDTPGGDKSKSKKKNQIKRKNANRQGGDLTSKIYQLMDRHKDVFFVIRMIESERVSTLPPIEDPDKDMHCDLMDGRDPFLTKARDEHWEFSSLRRTKYSTMSLLYKLHNPDTKFTAEEYTCNECQTTCTTRYHCKECKDYDLCTKCYQAQQANPNTKHQHPLEKIAPGPSLLGGGSNDSDESGANAQAKRRESIESCISSLVHAVKCRDANCMKPTCSKMKRVVEHTKKCPRKKNAGSCQICKQFIALCCYHAKHCEEKQCRIPFCSQIKSRLKQQQEAHRRRQAQLMHRRMAYASAQDDAPQTPNPGTPGPPTPGPATPGPNQGHNSNPSSKGGLSTTLQSSMNNGSGKPGTPMSNMTPFSPQPQQQIGNMNSQQQQQPTQNQGFQQNPMNNQINNPMNNQSGAPIGAVIAAQEVVNMAKMETNSNQFSKTNMGQIRTPMYRPNITMPNIPGPYNPNMQGHQVMSSNNSTSSGTMFINQQPKPPNQNYGMNNGMNETINMIRNHDSKDPKVLDQLRQNPEHVANFLKQNRNKMPSQVMNQVNPNNMHMNTNQMRNPMGNNMNQMQMNPNNMNMTNNMMPQNYPNMPTGPVQMRQQYNNMGNMGQMNRPISMHPMRMPSNVRQQFPQQPRGFNANMGGMNMMGQMPGSVMNQGMNQMNGPMMNNQMNQNQQNMGMNQRMNPQNQMMASNAGYGGQRPMMNQNGQNPPLMNMSDQPQIRQTDENGKTDIQNYQQIVNNL